MFDIQLYSLGQDLHVSGRGGAIWAKGPYNTHSLLMVIKAISEQLSCGSVEPSNVLPTMQHMAEQHGQEMHLQPDYSWEQCAMYHYIFQTLQ